LRGNEGSNFLLSETTARNAKKASGHPYLPVMGGWRKVTKKSSPIEVPELRGNTRRRRGKGLQRQ